MKFTDLGFDMNAFDSARKGRRFPAIATATLLSLGALGAAALVVRGKTRKAERTHPPIGQFLEVDGVRLHYVERGEGQPLVLLHGNGVMAEDFDLSGLIDLAARQYRVIAIDRPGFGHSERPRGRLWTPNAQAELLYRALWQLGVDQPIVVGHSWGTLVAIAMALRHPEYVRGLALLSGYYYPSMRLDVPLATPPAIPLLGDLMRHTVSPLIGRLIWPSVVRRLFGPAEPPPRFAAFPLWMALRPTQMRASAAESAMLIPFAALLSRRYRELRLPVAIVAGAADLVANAARNSERLHEHLSGSELYLVPGAGHMVHYTAQEQVMAAIDAVERSAGSMLSPVPELERTSHAF
jgi:pimeloyl-ACP methyl ester carboxylesterase